MPTDKPLVVIGLGQELRGDDAVGLEIVKNWQRRHPDAANSPFVRVELSPLPGLQLLELLRGAEMAVLVDAVHSGGAPGSIIRCTGESVASFESGAGSAHGWGVGETLALAKELEVPDLPSICIMGIEVGNLDLGEGLSDEVAATLPQAVERLHARVLAYLREVQTEDSRSVLPLTTA